MTDDKESDVLNDVLTGVLIAIVVLFVTMGVSSFVLGDPGGAAADEPEKRESINAEAEAAREVAAKQRQAKERAARNALAAKAYIELGGGVTMDAYQQLSDGMSYARAVEILGTDGTERSQSRNLVMYQWVHPNGGRMTAMFRNGRLTSKAQLGLP